MKLFVEQFWYPKNLLYEIFEEKLIKEINDDYAVLQFVGFYIDKKQEIYVVLPKLFGREGKLFNDVEIIEFTKENFTTLLKREKLGVFFIQEIIILLFHTLMRYQKEVSTKLPSELPVITTVNIQNLSILEMIFSMIDFHQKNHQIYIKETITTKRKTSKINWNKTIKNIMPAIQKEDIYYLHFKYSKSKLGQNDIILRIFYSLLNKFKHKYNFNISLNIHLPIIPLGEFIKLERRIPNLLKTIRGKYVRKDLKKIFNMLDKYYQQESNVSKREGLQYIAITNFNLMFEHMVNEILSDKEHLDNFKIQKDGKIIDHIYQDKSFLTEQNILFIGDSKYYKGENVDIYSTFKQFTYSRNLVHEFENKRDYFQKHNILLREDISRGYESIPNFFIFGYLDEKGFGKGTKAPILPLWRKYPISTNQFSNTFFDRDTFHIFHFKVDLLFLMDTYMNKSEKMKQKYGTLFRQTVRNRVAQFYNAEYDAFTLEDENLQDFIKIHYYILSGKVLLLDDNKAILVLEKDKDDSKIVKEIITSNTTILIKPVIFK